MPKKSFNRNVHAYINRYIYTGSLDSYGNYLMTMTIKDWFKSGTHKNINTYIYMNNMIIINKTD